VYKGLILQGPSQRPIREVATLTDRNYRRIKAMFCWPCWHSLQASSGMLEPCCVHCMLVGAFLYPDRSAQGAAHMVVVWSQAAAVMINHSISQGTQRVSVFMSGVKSPHLPASSASAHTMLL
jgi:hypothetical protein